MCVFVVLCKVVRVCFECSVVCLYSLLCVFVCGYVSGLFLVFVCVCMFCMLLGVLCVPL